MSSILISGCGITFSGERPTWTKVLRIAGAYITDLSGPAISNYLILNQLLNALYSDVDYSHVICQLTGMGKLDVELNDVNRHLMINDSIRNFEYQGYWPSSSSLEHPTKQAWKQQLYSPTMEEDDIVFKLLLLQERCRQLSIPLLIIPGYSINWTNQLIKLVNISDYIIYNEYRKDNTWNENDHTPANNVPIKEFQIKFAHWINDNFLKLDLPKLEGFRV